MQLQPLTTHNATCMCLTGTVVGLEKLSEQRITGRSFLQGESSLVGYYQGSHAGSPGHGAAHGSSYLFGQSELTTEYSYSTHFFVRDQIGKDWPIVVAGKLPVLEGHTVTCVYVKNVHSELALCTIINHNSHQVYRTITTRDLVHHLDMPTRKRVTRQLLSPSDKRALLSELRERWKPVIPWLLLTILIGLTIGCIGLIVTKRRESLGMAIVLLGLCPALTALGGIAYRYVREWRIKQQPTHEELVVRNRDLDDELQDIFDYIDAVARAICKS